MAVRIDHSKYLDSRWYNGSGIYGRVVLIERPDIHFRTWGVFVTTPEVTERGTTVRIDATVTNATDRDENVGLTIEVRDSDDSEIASGRVQARLTRGTDTHLRQELAIANPALWSPESPRLYSLVATLTRDGSPLDVVEIPFGIRSFRFDPGEGFFLNGRHTTLKGVCLHHDAGALGAAVPRDVWARRLRILKEAGTNAIRLSHNPAPFASTCKPIASRGRRSSRSNPGDSSRGPSACVSTEPRLPYQTSHRFFGRIG